MPEIAPWDEAKQAAAPAAVAPWDEAKQASGASPPAAPHGGAFFGAASLLPDVVQRHLPSFLSGPSVGEQLADTQRHVESERARLGRPLTLKEGLAAEPVMASPVAAGFATHQTGALAEGMEKAAAGASEKFIDKTFQRAVKPTVAGKKTSSQVDRYFDRARSAVSSIVENKANLKYDNGAIVGELPKSLEQFGEAIEQTKGKIFQQYDAMARAAGDAGAAVPLRPAVNELLQLAAKPSVQDLHPEISNYALKRALALAERGAYSPGEAQEAVANYNQSLQAFYRNPSYESASRASVDGMIANQLRQGLDKTITAATDPGYQELKRQYGALKEIEADVNKRAQVVGRQEPGGLLGTITNAMSAEELARGIFTLDPTAIASSIGIKAIGGAIRYRRSPNRAVTQLFDAAEEAASPTPPSAAATIPISPIVPDERRRSYLRYSSPGASAMGLQ